MSHASTSLTAIRKQSMSGGGEGTHEGINIGAQSASLSRSTITSHGLWFAALMKPGILSRIHVFPLRP
jgi:hypothetical protein